MEIGVLLGLFVLLLFIGFPIAFSLGISTMTYLIMADIPLTILPQRFFAGMDSFVPSLYTWLYPCRQPDECRRYNQQNY